MFNSLECVKRLEEVGVSREQAETHVQIMSETLESHLVTNQSFKEGMAALKAELKSDIAELRNELSGDISALRFENTDIRSEIKDIRNAILQSEYRQTIKLGTIVSAAMGILVLIMKLT